MALIQCERPCHCEGHSHQWHMVWTWGSAFSRHLGRKQNCLPPIQCQGRQGRATWIRLVGPIGSASLSCNGKVTLQSNPHQTTRNPQPPQKNTYNDLIRLWDSRKQYLEARTKDLCLPHKTDAVALGIEKHPFVSSSTVLMIVFACCHPRVGLAIALHERLHGGFPIGKVWEATIHIHTQMLYVEWSLDPELEEDWLDLHPHLLHLFFVWQLCWLEIRLEYLTQPV